jgi:predicted ATPase/DNA-binding winged helix-turn-helix (wHTH) protein
MHHNEKISNGRAEVSEQRRNLVYECGQWQIHGRERQLLACGVSIPIGSRAFDIIEVLVQSANKLVTKVELMERVWPGAMVGDSALQVQISAIRKAFDQDRAMLMTVSGRGYRLSGDWAVRRDGAPEQPASLISVPMPAETFQTNLPETALALIGRTIAAQQIEELLSAYRAVTLTGPGGIGKTALALRVSSDMRPRFNGDVWLIELASLSDPGLVASAVADGLGLNPGGDEITAEAVARAIGDKQLLLILDNCEHVIDAAARLVEAILYRCPRTTVLATSQELLRICGEYVYRVPPLEVPPRHHDELEDMLEHSAVRLFVTKLQALDSSFIANKQSVRGIVAICEQLDGIPLLIEFAAARAAMLGVRDVASRLEDRFRLLTIGRRTALPKHRTLRATLDWSYGLLPEAEQSLLGRLAVFVAGFTLEAAIAVMSDTGNNTSVMLEGIANLVAKSLLIQDRSQSGGRWILSETIRAYAFEKLVETGQAEATARRHALFYSDLLVPPDSSRPPRSIEDTLHHAQEIDNVRAALDWAFSPRGDRAIGVLLTAAWSPIWLHWSLMAECLERARRALEDSESVLKLSAPLQLQLYLAMGLSAADTAGPVEIAETALVRALEIAGTLNDLDTQLRILRAQASIQLRAGRSHMAQATAEQFSRVAFPTGNQANFLVGDRLIGDTLRCRDRLSEVQPRLQRELELYGVPEVQ